MNDSEQTLIGMVQEAARQIVSLQHQLRVAQLELMKANVLQEAAEMDLAGIKSAQRVQKQALFDIKKVTHPMRRSWTAIENILKGLEL